MKQGDPGCAMAIAFVSVWTEILAGVGSKRQVGACSHVEYPTVVVQMNTAEMFCHSRHGPWYQRYALESGNAKVSNGQGNL